MTRSRLKESPMVCVLLTGVIFGGYTLARLAAANFDPSVFVVAGDRFCDPANTPAGLIVLRDSYGFDGQFYYRLALDPFTADRTAHGITLDLPALRHQRFLYPALSHLVSMGNPRLVPAAMIALNLIGICLLAYLSGLLVTALGRSTLWGMALVIFPGFLLTFSRNTVEILEATLIVAGLLQFQKRRPALAAVFLSLAVMTRETSFLAVLGFLPAIFLARDAQRTPWYVVAAPAATFGAMQFGLYLNWGEVPILSSTGINLAAPFTGSLTALLSVFTGDGFQKRKAAELLFLLALGSIGLWKVVRGGRRFYPEACAFVVMGAALLLLPWHAWIEDRTFLRVSSLFYLFGQVVLLRSGGWTAWFISGYAAMLWLWLFATITLGRM